MKLLPKLLLLSLAVSTTAFSADKAKAKEKKPDRPTPPTRAFDGPGAPTFIRLDGKPGANPPVDANGDFVVGPEYVAAPENNVT